jgi:hypothetical protein
MNMAAPVQTNLLAGFGRVGLAPDVERLLTTSAVELSRQLFPAGAP